MITLTKLNDTHTEQGTTMPTPSGALPGHQTGIRRNDLNTLHGQMTILATRGHIGLWLPAMIDETDGAEISPPMILWPDHSGCTRSYCPSA